MGVGDRIHQGRPGRWMVFTGIEIKKSDVETNLDCRSVLGFRVHVPVDLWMKTTKWMDHIQFQSIRHSSPVIREFPTLLRFYRVENGNNFSEIIISSISIDSLIRRI
ncbi:uncharacterized protein [Fopius arisanus]|uniref:Uncharacterized protein n=1 Tax=Fopius arisanus TaxID=64838 RepID=A0A9R1T1W1_9HYME|nr:PREDICTED: uncharacterized protein LOC105265439 [Fopius arisanus]